MHNILDYFEKTVENYKEKTAVEVEENSLTYEELMNVSKRIGSSIIDKKINRSPIVVFMNKGIEALSSFLGIVYSGNYYCLLNPELPEYRLNNILSVLDTKLIITDDEFYDTANNLFKELDIEIVNIKTISNHEILIDKIMEVRNESIDYDPLYINFTSGSTGIPKGVVISHRSVIDFILEFTKTFGINETDFIGNQAPFDFDVSVKDIYSCLFTGAKLVIIPRNYFSQPMKLLDYLCDKKITNMTWAVSALCLITTFHGLDYKVPTSVKRIIYSGENMPLKHLRIWMDKLPEATFINVYGPTEITCNCTYHIIDRNREYTDSIPIGKHFKNERVILLDDDNNEITEPGIVGNICVTGTSLGLGYYNNMDKTNEVFVQNPLTKNYLELLYKTGDCGEYNELGELVFRSRKDFQIKYQGHRIELEEIEQAMMKNEKVMRATVLFDEEKSKLYGFYVGDITKEELVESLKVIIPEYMIPKKILKLDSMPLTKNGKIDRKQLMEVVKQ